MTTVVLLRFGGDGFERFAASRPAFDAELLAQLRAAIAASLPLPRVSCYGRAGAIDDPPAVAVEWGGRGDRRASHCAAERSCERLRASTGQREPVQACAGQRGEASAGQREPARNSAKQREPARANASQGEPSQARASARRVGRGIPSERAQKGRQRPTYFELFLKRGAIAKFP